jgi:hypothetical protein
MGGGAAIIPRYGNNSSGRRDLFPGEWPLRRGAEVQKNQWAPVNALLLDFKVIHQSCGRASNCYQAYFTFQYEVQGRRFIGGAQSDHLGSYSSEVSDWIQYQQGSHQQIRYNPLQPQEITIDDLNVRSFREPMKLGGWGGGLILIGLLLRTMTVVPVSSQTVARRRVRIECRL